MFFYSLITLWNIRRILAEALCRNALLHVVKTFQSFIHQSCKILHYAVVDKVMYRSFFAINSKGVIFQKKEGWKVPINYRRTVTSFEYVPLQSARRSPLFDDLKTIMRERIGSARRVPYRSKDRSKSNTRASISSVSIVIRMQRMQPIESKPYQFCVLFIARE